MFGTLTKSAKGQKYFNGRCSGAQRPLPDLIIFSLFTFKVVFYLAIPYTFLFSIHHILLDYQINSNNTSTKSLVYFFIFNNR